MLSHGRIALGVLVLLTAACAPAAEPAPTPPPKPTEAAAKPAEAKPTLPPPGQAEAPKPAATVPAKSAPVTASLRLMGWASSPEEDRLLNEVLADFSRQYPSIQVKFEPVPEYATKLQTDLAAGSAADVFYVDSLLAPDLMKRGLLMELDSHVQRDKVDTSDFYPGLLKAFQWKGKTYGLPKDWSSLAMIWNAELAREAGLDRPPATWDEVKAAAQKLTKGKQVFGAVTPPELPRLGAFVYQAGGQLVSQDGTKMAINRSAGLQALDFYYGLYKDSYATTPADTGTQWPGDTLAKGKAAMVFEGNWIFPFLKKDAPNLSFGIAELPSGPKGKGTFAFTVSYSINARTQSGEAAWLLVNYLTGLEGMQRWTSLGLAMPSRKSLEAGWIAQFKEREPFLRAGAYAQPWQLGPGGQEINDKVATPALQAVFSGRMSPQEALAEIERKGNEVLARPSP